MSGGTRNVRIYLSQQSFALLVDTMCSFSKKTGRFQTMRMTVQAACSRLQAHSLVREDLDRFLDEYPVEGEIGVWLEVTPKWANEYDALRTRVKQLGKAQGVDRILVPFAVHLAAVRNLL